MSEDDIARAARAIGEGDLVVFPTETVYGLGADALEPAAVEAVFQAKGRDRSKPLSLAVPTVDAATEYVRASDRERRFMDRFLPGPVTVVCEHRSAVPDALTAGRDRVGVRVPDHDVALALLERAAPTPVTATSANVSGGPNAREVDDLDPRIREAAAAVVDGGRTPGGESTVVDVAAGTIHRRGAMADEIARWLEE